MLWLQIASQTAIALLALVARIQTYGNFSTSYTVALLLDATWPHLLFIADDVTHSYIKSNFLLAAPPARYSLPAAPTIPSSKDLLQWMPTPDVYASLHIPSLTATSITRPSTVTATWNSTTSSMRLEYPTKDIDVREELINPATSILMYLVAYGTFTIAIACCSVYLVLKRHQRGRILSVNVEAKSEDNASALPPFIEQLILNGGNASTDNIPHAPRQKSNLSTFWTVERRESMVSWLREAPKTEELSVDAWTGVSADRTALYPDAVPHSERGGVADTFDTQAAQSAQKSLENAFADPRFDSTDMETATNNDYATTPLEGDHVPMDLSLSTDVGTRIHDVNHAAGNPCHDRGCTRKERSNQRRVRMS
ncbi:predicted protein [Postia placenta Mad-698-R]|nr:predicted protein [Postia placenta Mad-698-R]